MATNYSNLPGVPTTVAPQYQPNAYGSYQSNEQAANAANQARYQQGLGLWNNIVGMYKPGGLYEQNAMAAYQEQKNQALGSYQKNLIDSGLYNTSTTAGVGAAYDKSIGSGYTRDTANAATNLQSQAMQGAAQWIYNKNEQAPDMNQMANLYRGAANQPGRSPSYGGMSGVNPPSAPQNNPMQTGGSGTLPGGTPDPTAAQPPAGGYFQTPNTQDTYNPNDVTETDYPIDLDTYISSLLNYDFGNF